MSESGQETLREAIARNSGAVLSLPSAGMLRHCKTRFLAEDKDGFWIESVPGEAALVNELVGKGAAVGIAFKQGSLKVIFAANCLRHDPAYRVNPELTVAGLLLTFPQQIKVVQRRANYRVAIPGGCEISVRVWRIPEQWILRDKPSGTLEIPVRMRDLSTGGMGVLCPAKDTEPVRMVADQRLRLQIRYADYDVVLEGRARHMQFTPDKSLRLGVQFKKLEDDLDGRQILSTLTTIVGQLHREEIRRLRLGLTG